MARSTEWESVPMAVGDPKPAWPLPSVSPKFATWSFGGGRPFGCEGTKCERWHAGIDLTNAPDGALVVAPEDAEVVAVDRGWSEGSKAIFLRTKTGLFLVLGGVKLNSHQEFQITAGKPVQKGQSLARVLGSYGMIHFETYDAAGRSANTPWRTSEPPPKGLLNPTNYVERMVGDTVSLVQTRQRHEALHILGYYEGDVDAPWSAASTAALRSAQQALGVAVDGKWGPKTEDAIQRALAVTKGCAGGECGPESEVEPEPASEPAPAETPWLRRLLVGGLALGGLAVGVALVYQRPRDHDSKDR